jgi:hypothetical protein
MKAIKRWTAVVVALTAVAALAVPSMASAFKIESSAGKLAKVGTQLTLTGNVRVETGAIPIYGCRTASNANVTKNESTGVSFEAVNEGVAECNEGTELGLNRNRIKEFKLSFQTNKSSQTASLSFTSETRGRGAAVCKWSAQNIPFGYTSGGHVITIYEALVQRVSGNCESGYLNGEFEVSIGTTPVILR